MNKDKILTGYDLVSKGPTKLGSTLPEAGIKEIFPNGSWLEKKQIQAALEARKHLIEVERIEKSAVLSHAVWREELMMAEVTQKVGGYWQYLGQNIGKDLFLNPEEALFLMEINCLYLTHNNVKVSLQQAYTLLLREKLTHLKYKVYASLSRLGYRLFRHPIIDFDKNIMVDKKNPGPNEEINDKNCVEANALLDKDEIINESCKIKEELDTENVKKSNDESEDINRNPVTSKASKDNTIKQKNICGWKKLEILEKRKLRPCNNEKLHEYFNSVPEISNKTIVACKVADKKYLPHGLNLSKSTYCIDLKNFFCKSDQSTTETRYSPNDEINGSHIPRLRNTSYIDRSSTSDLSMSIGCQNVRQFSFRSCRFRRPFHNFTFSHINTMFEPSTNMLFVPPFLLRPQIYIRPQSFNQNINQRKHSRPNAQIYHLESIKALTMRLKNLLRNGNFEQQNIIALRRLIQTYNTRYKTHIRVTDDLDLIMGELVDTITLDDDEPVEKRRRVTDKDVLFNDNLNALKQFAAKLKILEKEGKSSSRHRRYFSKLLKTFNQSYNEEYYITESHELGNKRHVTLDTSDSDCVMNDVPEFPTGKKLKNPFNVLKRLSEKQTESIEPSSSNIENDVATINSEEMPSDCEMYSKQLLDAISSKWLPNIDDFGRAELVTKDFENNEMDIRQEAFLYDFIKLTPCQSNNWLELKKSYYNGIKEAVTEFHKSIDNTTDLRVNSIVKPKDCLNMASVLKKLSIIQTEKRVKDDCSLIIDFDVYNRDVQNFRKTNPPVPHFRILCLSLSSNMPSGDEIAALHSKYEDNVAIVFAIVGDSISYVQVNPMELPVYLSKN